MKWTASERGKQKVQAAASGRECRSLLAGDLLDPYRTASPASRLLQQVSIPHALACGRTEESAS
jgi:hypothetical protein